MIRSGIEKVFGYGLETTDIRTIEILVIDQDRVWSNTKSTKLPKGLRLYSTLGPHITPIKSNVNIKPSPITTMNIKTIDTGIKTEPCLVTLTHNNGHISKPFILRTNINMIMAMNTLWSNVFKYIISNHNIKTIFVHNLAESGLYIYKYLFQSFSKSSISCIIDNDNKFITITLKIHSRTITWLDSNRIFPVNIVELCNIFEVKICLMNPISIDKLYREHNWVYQTEAVQECQSFYQALIKAQAQYLTNYSIDITKVVSTSSLSLQIYRKHFMSLSIPILQHNQDIFIRNSYYGGATDYYQAYGENIKYYDVNSLYPHVMKMDMPFEIIKFHKDMANISIISPIFGFFEAEITTPDNIMHPLLPLKLDSEIIYPIGKFKGIYFSEELRNAANNGYKIKLISGYEFSKVSLFTNYVDHFYNIKRNSTGPMRYISKLQLNTLYGIFGRKQELIQTININPSDLPLYASVYEIKAVLEVSDKIWTLLINSKIKLTGPIGLKPDITVSLPDTNRMVKSNVGIASAVTAYARIYMSQFKNRTDFKLLYTDTDSIMIDRPLPEDLIGKELGLMKDELSGLSIKEAYFLGIKQFGYWYKDKQGNRIEKSVFAGVKRDSLTFEEIVKLFKGEIINKISKERRFKSIKKLNIILKDISTQISFKPKKLLLDNQYQPIRIHNNKIMNYLQKWINKIRQL